MSGAIPAPGFQTIDKKGMFLPAQAIAAVTQLRRNGHKVPAQAVELLHMLCDQADVVHGQFYGSWEHFGEKYALSRSFVFRWLPRLAELGLVEELGYLPGRRTTTWQVLPHVYRVDNAGELLVSQIRDTSALVSQIRDTSELPASPAQVSQLRDSNSLSYETPLVSQLEPLLVSQIRDTNIRTSRTSSSTSPYVAASQRVLLKSEEISEEGRASALAALAELEARWQVEDSESTEDDDPEFPRRRGNLTDIRIKANGTEDASQFESRR